MKAWLKRLLCLHKYEITKDYSWCRFDTRCKKCGEERSWFIP